MADKEENKVEEMCVDIANRFTLDEMQELADWLEAQIEAIESEENED